MGCHTIACTVCVCVCLHCVRGLVPPCACMQGFRTAKFPTVAGKILPIQEHLNTQSGEESSLSGRFNPVGCLQQYC